MIHLAMVKPNAHNHIGFLIKEDAFDEENIRKYYTNHFDGCDVTALSLDYVNNKAPMKVVNPCIDSALKKMQYLGIDIIVVADGTYFKKLTGQPAGKNIGYTLPCVIKGYEHMVIVPSANYQQVFYDPRVLDTINKSNQTLLEYIDGSWQEPGHDIIHSEEYPDTIQGIRNALVGLHRRSTLAVDIEAFSLVFNEAFIGTIAFAWDKHNGLAFAVDAVESPNCFGHHIKCVPNLEVRKLLKEFFKSYKGKLVWQNGYGYDAKVLIYELFMNDLLDHKGSLEGIEAFFNREHDDTKILNYLATNTTAGNRLGLKEGSAEFTGNYAEDVHNIRLLEMEPLLKYNLIDALATFYSIEKWEPKVVADEQVKVLDEVFRPSTPVLCMTELVGMPLHMPTVYKNTSILEDIRTKQNTAIADSLLIKAFRKHMSIHEWNKDLRARKEKAVNPEAIKERPKDFYDGIEFNPGSGNQVVMLLHDFLNLPVLDYTKSKNPSTTAKAISKIMNTLISDHELTEEEIDSRVSDLERSRNIAIATVQTLAAIAELKMVSTILDTFMTTFIEKSIPKADGRSYLHGSLILGGTVSGRLSSKNPNMANLPSGSKYAYLVKECFVPPKGWLMVGADFNSLEDMISALTTRDTNKMKVYTDKYDGHCLRAYGYFGDEMPDIDPNSVESINSIAKKYKKLRQKSKMPTFALTYGGTWATLVSNLGLSKKEAIEIEESYHRLYVESDEWVRKQLEQATHDGYVSGAFGLRLRTPILAKTILNSEKTPREAAAEGRTAGNMLGQSYCILNSRAANEMMERVWASPYRYDILPINQIHDASYYLIRDDIAVIEWFNKNLTDCMAWQGLPEIQHDQVKIGGEVDIFHPNWNASITLKPTASRREIVETCKKALIKQKE